MMELSYRRHRFPPVVIQHAVWLYLRFTLCLLRLLPAGAVAGWGLHPLESAALSRRTPIPDIWDRRRARSARFEILMGTPSSVRR